MEFRRDPVRDRDTLFVVARKSYGASKFGATLTSERILAVDDARALGGHFRVERDVVFPLLGDRVIRVDGFDRTFAAAGVAMDAGVRIDEQHTLAFVKAVAGADDDAVGVLAAETRFRHDVGH